MNLVNKKTIFLLLLLASYSSWGQVQCKPIILPFIGGEELIYDVDYLMGNNWVSAAKVRFIVKDSIFNSIPCYYVEGKGRTLKNYDWFFKVRDKYASFIEKETHNPLHFIRRVREGDFYLNYDYDFNFNNLTSKVYEKRRNVEKSETLAISSCSFDIISSVYFARAIPFQKLSKGLKQKNMISRKTTHDIKQSPLTPYANKNKRN